MSLTRREFLKVGGTIAAGTVVLPIVYKPLARGLPNLPALGAMLEEGAYKPIDQLQWVAPGSMVRYRIRWDEVEIVPGGYAWDKPDAFMQACTFPVMVNVICTPEAYRMETPRCSPPRPEYAGRLVDFIRALVERYSPAALEFWNEPEVSATEAAGINAAHVLGGFGISLAPYYGYLLRLVWDQFQQGWYSTWLVAGSLMLADGGAWWRAANAWNCYDALSYHSYVNYPGTDYDRIGNGAALLRGMGESVPLILSETALLADNDSPLFRDAQAAFLHYVAPRREVYGLANMTWYPLDTNLWRNSDMVKYGVPQPVWYEYQEASQ